jgi:DNA-binding response OmpR family regulator
MSLEIIQIIEDDPTQAKVLDLALRRASYRTNVAFDGQTGLEDAQRLHPALVLLDLMLPGIDGREVCRLLRRDPKTTDIPIIMITALGSEAHRVEGLELGADDYMVKPFNATELVARVKAILRRVRPPAHSTAQGIGEGLVLEEDRFVALFRGRRVTLSGPEWRILQRLVRHDGQVVPREELTSILWGEDGLIHEHALDRHIQALSQKLRDDAICADSIVTVPGGYRLSALRP